MKPVTIALIAVAVIAAGFWLSDYFPRRESTNTKLLKNAIASAARRQAEAESQLRAKERELDHVHTMVVHDTAEVKRQKLAYDFGRTHLDTTSIDSLKAQLHRADSVVSVQAVALHDALNEAALATEALALANRVIVQANYREDRLEDLNKGIQRELEAKTRGQWKHDAKVVTATLAVRSLLQLVGK